MTRRGKIFKGVARVLKVLIKGVGRYFWRAGRVGRKTQGFVKGVDFKTLEAGKSRKYEGF